MGKTTTAQLFAEAGIPAWDADAAVHRLYAPGGAAVRPIAQLRPEAVMNDGISRDALREWIAENPGALSQIESVVHPLVARDRREFITRNSDAPIVLLDIPLLYETGGASEVDAVVVVTAPAEVQRQRVLARGSMSETEFNAILARQIPDDEKRARADYVIQTTTIEQARAAVQNIIDDIKENRIHA